MTLFFNMCAKLLQLCQTLWDPMYCTPPRLLCPWGFSKQELWSGLPCPPPGYLPNPETEPMSLMSPALAGRFFIPLVPPGKPIYWASTNNCALCCAMLCLVAQLCPTLCNPMDSSLPGSSVHGDSAGKNIGEGCLQGIFPTQGANPGLLHFRQIL